MQSSHGSELGPVKAAQIWIKHYPKCWNHTIEIRLLSPRPPIEKWKKDQFINKVTGPHKELLDKKVNRNHTTIYFIEFLKATPSNSVVYICRLLVLNPSSRFKTFLFILNGWSCGKLPILCKIKQIFLGHISCLFILFVKISLYYLPHQTLKLFWKQQQTHTETSTSLLGDTRQWKKRVLKSSQNFKPVWMES